MNVLALIYWFDFTDVFYIKVKSPDEDSIPEDDEDFRTSLSIENDEDGRPIPNPIQYWTSDERRLLEATPYSSAEVERIFSVFKAMLRDNRQSFIFENFKKILIVKCFLQKVK